MVGGKGQDLPDMVEPCCGIKTAQCRAASPSEESFTLKRARYRLAANQSARELQWLNSIVGHHRLGQTLGLSICDDTAMRCNFGVQERGCECIHRRTSTRGDVAGRLTDLPMWRLGLSLRRSACLDQVSEQPRQLKLRLVASPIVVFG